MALKLERPWGWELMWAVKPETVGRVLHIRRGHRFRLEAASATEGGGQGAEPGEREAVPGGPGAEQVVLCSGLLMVVWENALGHLEEAVLRPGDLPLDTVATRHRMIALEDVAVLAITPSVRTELVRVDEA